MLVPDLAAPLRLPSPLQARLEAAAAGLLRPEPGRDGVDFARPPGEPALSAPTSVSWRVFKNPVALFVGGAAAVLLELAEPRVREGVWRHSDFRRDPARRLRRTGLAAMVTVYGPRSAAEAMIAGVGRRHARVRGTTPDGRPYAADDPELLTWVHATAAWGFLAAYQAWVAPLPPADRDRYYAEGRPAAKLYGAPAPPGSEADLAALFRRSAPTLERSEIVFEFLDLLGRAPVLPPPLRPAQALLVRAAVQTTPPRARQILGLGPAWDLRPWETALLRAAGAAADRLVLHAAPPAQACRRLGLPEDWLYRRA